MKHRVVYKKQRIDYLEVIEEEDELIELRHQKWLEQMRVDDKKRADQLNFRYTLYFYSNGFCKNHDRDGCSECRHYANGRCPSYWEERY